MKHFPLLIATCGLLTLSGLAGQEAGFAQASAAAQERKTAMETLKQKLDTAKTAEEKRAIIDQWREQNRGVLEQKKGQEKSQQQVLAEMKAKAAGNPEMSRRVEQMEARLKAVETLKTASAALAEAKGDEKAKAQEALLKARENLTKVQQDQMAEMKATQTARQNAEAARPLTPEAAAAKARADQRIQEIEQLKEAMKQAKPEERTKILQEWRAKQEAGLAAQKPQISSPPPSGKSNP